MQSENTNDRDRIQVYLICVVRVMFIKHVDHNFTTCQLAQDSHAVQASMCPLDDDVTGKVQSNLLLMGEEAEEVAAGKGTLTPRASQSRAFDEKATVIDLGVVVEAKYFHASPRRLHRPQHPDLAWHRLHQEELHLGLRSWEGCSCLQLGHDLHKSCSALGSWSKVGKSSSPHRCL